MLLTTDQILKFKQLTRQVNNVKVLEPYIEEAQEFDLRAFLGEELYIDLLDKYDTGTMTDAYDDLYEGLTYTVSTLTYKHEGIVPIMAYFTYARYVQNSNVASTKFGLVNKTNEFSDPISEKQLTRIIQQAKSGAIVYQERVRFFLDAKVTDYPLWKGGRDRRKGSIRITGVGGNSTDGDIYYNGYTCSYCKRKREDCRCP